MADLLYVCPKCMGFCRTTVHGKSIKCPRCRDITLVELELAGDEWKTMSDDERHKYLADIGNHEEQEAVPEVTSTAMPMAESVKAPAKKVVRKVVRKQASPAAEFIPEPAAAATPAFIPEEEPLPVFTAETEPTPVFTAEAVSEPSYIPEAEPMAVFSPEPEAEQVAVFTPEPEAVPEPVVVAAPVVAATPIETPAPVKAPAKKVVKKVVRKQAEPASRPAPETAMQTATPSPASVPEMQVNKEDDRGNGREFKQPRATFGNVAYRTETAASSPNVWNEEQREAYRQKEKERQAVEEEKEEEKPVKGFFKKKSKEKKTEDLDKKDKEKLSDIEASVSGAKEEQKQQTKNPKAVRNKVIVASTFSVMVAALATTTFIIPSFRFRDEMSALRKANVGDIVTYGKYKGNTEWIVLDRKDNRVLCISNYGVGDERADEVVLWETSPVRERLNSTFMNSAFNIFERVRIVSTKEIRENEPDYRVEYVSPDVVDKMFMLKDEEVKEYIASNSDRMTQLSDISVHPACWIDIH